MKWYNLLFCLFFIFSGEALATSGKASVLVSFEIQEEGKVVEQLDYYFDQPLTNETLRYLITQPLSHLKVTSHGKGLLFETNSTPEQTMIIIRPQQPLQNLTLGFEVNHVIFSNDELYHFFTDLSFDPYQISSLFVKVVLPPGYIVSQQDYKPRSGIVTSNGKNIILEWRNLDLYQPLFFSVKYQKVKNTSSFLWVFIFLFTLLIFLIFLYYHTRKVKKVFLEGFSDDEKKVITFIMQKGNIYQREIQKQFMLSRVKTTRIIKKLETKELISKEELGRSNKISWKR